MSQSLEAGWRNSGVGRSKVFSRDVSCSKECGSGSCGGGRQYEREQSLDIVQKALRAGFLFNAGLVVGVVAMVENGDFAGSGVEERKTTANAERIRGEVSVDSPVIAIFA